MSFHFAYPAVLGAFLLAAAWFWLSLKRKRAALTHSQAGILASLAGPGGALLSRIPLILRLICLVLLILAAARPQFYNVSREIKTPGVDIMLCLDASGSMQALDFELDGEPVDRLTAVKKVVSEFIQKAGERPGGAGGLSAARPLPKAPSPWTRACCSAWSSGSRSAWPETRPPSARPWPSGAKG